MGFDTVLQKLSYETKLEEDTCLDLLNKGWTFVQKIDQPSRWESPLISLKNREVSVVTR